MYVFPRYGVARVDDPIAIVWFCLKCYWESRFAEEESYDWLAGYDALRSLLSREVRRDDNILVIGCGNSGIHSTNQFGVAIWFEFDISSRERAEAGGKKDEEQPEKKYNQRSHSVFSLWLPHNNCTDLSHSMYMDGYSNICSIDFSKNCIDQLIAKHQDKPDMKCMYGHELSEHIPP